MCFAGPTGMPFITGMVGQNDPGVKRCCLPSRDRPDKILLVLVPEPGSQQTRLTPMTRSSQNEF